MLIIGFLLTTSFIYFSIGYYTGREKVFVYISLFLAGLAVRLLFTADLLILTFLPDLSWTAIIKGDYLSYYLSVVFFILFVFNYLDKEIDPLIKFGIIFYLINSIIVILAPPYVFSRLLIGVNIVSLILGLYIFYLILINTFRDEKSSKGLLLGTLFLLVSSLIEIVSTQLGTKIITSFTLGVIVFVIILIFEVNKNFSLKISSEREQIEFLEDISNKDGLTGLFNHRYVCQMVEEIQKKKNDKKYSFAMMDLDNFKMVNDTYGHKKGDLVLLETANIIKENIRENDIAARYGGEEFLIIFKADIKSAFVIAERIRSKIEAEIFARTGVYITISGGVAELTNDKTDIIKEADQLLYKAKRLGKNRIEI